MFYCLPRCLMSSFETDRQFGTRVTNKSCLSPLEFWYSFVWKRSRMWHLWLGTSGYFPVLEDPNKAYRLLRYLGTADITHHVTKYWDNSVLLTASLLFFFRSIFTPLSHFLVRVPRVPLSITFLQLKVCIFRLSRKHHASGHHGWTYLITLNVSDKP